MENAWLVELTQDAIEETDRILRMSVSEYSKEFGVETERVDKAKIEKAQTLVGNLRFFLDKGTGKSKKNVASGEVTAKADDVPKNE